jgi:phosphoinositide 3-/4-kinase-like protein
VPSIERFGIDYDIRLDRPPTGGAITAAAFRFDPNQPRDSEGRWSETPGLPGGGSGLSAWIEQEDSADLPVETADMFRLGTDIAKIMRRDGTTVGDPAAFWDAATEALAGDTITPRQYIANLDRQYGTEMGARTAAALAERDGTDPAPAASGPRLPDFNAPYADRVAAMEANSRTTPRATTALSGGTLAEVVRNDWDDRSRTVTKKALRPAGDISPLRQADAEELAGLVAAALGVRAPAVRRTGPDEVELEYMPGRTGMEEYGAIAPKSITEAPVNAKVGLLDYLTNNADRHTGNWTIGQEGSEVYAIDHGLAFQDNIGILAYGPFALAHGFSIGTPKNIRLSELDEIRTRLEALRGDFASAGRADWYNGMISRLDDVFNRLEVS